MANLFDVLEGAGNFLDLPGSSVRDLLSGRDPLDQWATPFQGKNRASGRDMLRPWLGENEETGMSGWLSNPMEGVKDLVGFGAEVLTDPTNLIPASWFTKALKGRKSAAAVNKAIDAVAASPDRARLSREMAKGFGKSSDPTMKLLDAFTLRNKLKPEDVYRRISVGDQLANPMSPTGNQLLQPVHHGTPHEFASEPGFPKGRPRLDMIGTGEGTQVRGRGIYFAESGELGDKYRRSVAVSQLREKMFNLYDEGDAPFAITQVMENLDSFTSSEQKVLKSLDEHDWLGFEYPHQAVREALSSKVGDRYGDIEGLLDVVKEHGNKYKLDLPDEDIPRMLDHDEWLDQQPEHVTNALTKLADSPEVTSFVDKQQRLQEELSRINNTPGFRFGTADGGSGWIVQERKRLNDALLANRDTASSQVRAGAQVRILLDQVRKPSSNWSASVKGKAVTDKLEEAIGPEETARVMREAGIPGAVFKDAVSRNQNPLRNMLAGRDVPDTRNYSVWDQDVLDRMTMLGNRDVLYQNPIESSASIKAATITKGRDAALVDATRKWQEGLITKAERDDIIDRYKPVSPYKSAPVPVTTEEVFAINTNKIKEGWGAHEKVIKDGDQVGLRLDIPSYTNHKQWINSIHYSTSGKARVAYGPVSRVENATFKVPLNKAVGVASDTQNKSPFATIDGEWKGIRPEEAHAKLKDIVENPEANPEWRQVGMDPERHAYFYDRENHRIQYTSADEVIQVGPLVVAKNPVAAAADDTNVLFQGENPIPRAPVFYSKVVEALDKKTATKSGDQWLIPDRFDRTQLEKILLGYGVKKEELADLAPHMDEMFAQSGGKITKDALREMVQDKTLGELKVTELGSKGIANREREITDLRDRLSRMEGADASVKQPLYGRISEIPRENHVGNRGGTQYSNYMVPGGVPGTARELLFGHPSATEFGGGHYGDFPDTFAHARLDDMILPDGSKSLRINEIQSDLHQKAAAAQNKALQQEAANGLDGWHYAYLDEMNMGGLALPERAPDDKIWGWGHTPESARAAALENIRYGNPDYIQGTGLGSAADLETRMGVQQEDTYTHQNPILGKWDRDGAFDRLTEKSPEYTAWLKENKARFPLKDFYTPANAPFNAPFKESWHELALKKILRTAAEEGYDSVSLVKGKDIAEAVGGPPHALGKFYDEKITNTLKKMVEKHGGKVTEVAGATEKQEWLYEAGEYSINLADGSFARVYLHSDDDYALSIDFEAHTENIGRFESLEDARSALEREVNIPDIEHPSHTVFTLPQALHNSVLQKGQSLYQKQRGMVTFGDQGKALINPIDPDFSTAPHEVSHVIRRMLQGESADQAADIFGGAKGGRWSREAEEGFAQGAEGYLQTASTKSPAMQQTMQQMNQGMSQVYDNPMPVRDGGTELFERVFGITATSSPLDKVVPPGLAKSLGYGAAYNAIVRFQTNGGVQ